MNIKDHKSKNELLNKSQKKSDSVTKVVGKKNLLKNTVEEIGGPQGPEPTRYGDWERKGIAVDF